MLEVKEQQDIIHAPSKRFMTVDECARQLRPYGVDHALLLAALQDGWLSAWTHNPVDDVYLQMPVDAESSYQHCYIKRSDVARYIDVLPKMVVAMKMHCAWHSVVLHFVTSVEPCVIYIPSVVRYDLYLPKRYLDSCVIQAATKLNGEESTEIVFHSEEEREQAVSFYKFPDYVPADLVDEVKDTCAAFELQIRTRNIGYAKTHGDYPVRYVRLDLPE